MSEMNGTAKRPYFNTTVSAIAALVGIVNLLYIAPMREDMRRLNDRLMATERLADRVPDILRTQERHQGNLESLSTRYADSLEGIRRDIGRIELATRKATQKDWSP